MTGFYDGPVTVVVRSMNYWGKGKTLEEALTKVRSASGSRKIEKGLVDVFINGTPEQHEEITVNGMGTVSWPGDDADGNRVEILSLGGALMKALQVQKSAT